MHQSLAPPVVSTTTGTETILAVDQKWLQETTPLPPKGWNRPDFDDSAWLRGPGRLATGSPMLRRLSVRGSFEVTDPAKVRGLRLSVGYHGGAIVRVNGKELARGRLPGGERESATMYPADAYYYGKITWGYMTGGPAHKLDAYRTRTFNDVAVPASLLRRGRNVMTIEVHRAVANPIVRGARGRRKFLTPFNLNWSHCSLRHAQLSADSANGLATSAFRPDRLQVWNGNMLANDFAADFGNPAEPIAPIAIDACRNGSFSGKVIVGSRRPLKNLAAGIGDLKGPSVIAASNVRIRYGFVWGTEEKSHERYAIDPMMLGALAERPPKEVPVRRAMRTHYNGRIALAPPPVHGAVASIWVTVDVPADAPAGDYAATLTIRADGEQPARAPVKLHVEDWALPDSQDYRTWVGLIQSPDTLEVEYKLKPWSDKHFEMIVATFKHLNRIGSRILYIPVICHTNLGNAESMVRWVRKPDRKYGWDFTLMDRYLDTAEKHMGKPKVVCFWVWEKFLFPTVTDPKTYEQYRPRIKPGRTPARLAEGPEGYVGRGPKVTILDSHTGKTHTEHLPYLLDPISKGVWKPLFVELRKRMKARGLTDAMMLGTPSDIVMRPEHFAFWEAVAPGSRWVNHSHFDLTRVYAAGGGKLGYYTSVMNVWFPGYPEDGREYGWKRKELHAQLRSRWGRDYFELTTWRHMAELNITGKQRGFGRVGADLWRIGKNRYGRRGSRISARYPESSWRSNNLCSSLLAPGPDGPVATVRYEMTREGVQECEARIFIERALTDEKLRRRLGPELAGRAQAVLDERLRFMIKGVSPLNLEGYSPGLATNAKYSWWNNSGINGHRWFIGSGWQQRTRKLYATAAEVARKLM